MTHKAVLQSQIQLGRAISSEFLARKLSIIRIVTIVLLIAAAAIFVLLVPDNLWWLLLALPVTFLAIICAVILLVCRFMLRVYRPAMSQEQARLISVFVDKVERVADAAGTPVPIIIFRVARDVIMRREQMYIMEVAHDSSSLHTDFLMLEKKFKS